MKNFIKKNFRFFAWLSIGLMPLLMHGCASVNESQSSNSAAVNQCVLIDTDFDIDDMMAIPLVIGHKHVAAIVTSEGYTNLI